MVRKNSGKNRYFLKINISTNIVELRTTEIPLVNIIGQSILITPYIVHKRTPKIKTQNIQGDTSSTFFDFQAFKIWGMAAMVVNIPAKIPISAS